MDKKTFITLLNKQSKGETSPGEEDQIKLILDLIQKRELVWLLTPEQEFEIKSRIKKKVDAGKITKSIPQQSIFSVFKWAAVLIVGFSFTYILFSVVTDKMNRSAWIEKVTSGNQKATIKLPDGSMVYLNTNSRIRFPEKFSENSRNVDLEGEGFIEVVKDETRPFKVISNGTLIRVLGTSFNINATNKDFVEVAVASGMVGVTSDLSKESSLKNINPNQKATINKLNKEVLVEEVDINKVLAWKAEKMSFDLLPFDKVIASIGEMYHMEIDIKSEVNEFCLIRATYSNKSLYSILYGLKNIVDFEWHKENDRKLILNYKGCIN